MLRKELHSSYHIISNDRATGAKSLLETMYAGYLLFGVVRGEGQLRKLPCHGILVNKNIKCNIFTLFSATLFTAKKMESKLGKSLNHCAL